MSQIKFPAELHFSQQFLTQQQSTIKQDGFQDGNRSTQTSSNLKLLFKTFQSIGKQATHKQNKPNICEIPK